MAVEDTKLPLDKADLGHWVTKLELPDVVPFGFVYEITCKTTGKKYIGKKQMVTILKRDPLKGKKRKRLSLIETDWRKYTSSSNILNEMIKKEGKEQFTFEILQFGSCKWELAYAECLEQFNRKVIFKQDEYLNGIINIRLAKPPAHLDVKKYILD